MFTRASVYYLRCTTKNRLAQLARRLRQPKYLIGLSLTIAYFWLIFFRNPAFVIGSDPGAGAGAVDVEAEHRTSSMVVGLFYVFQVVVTWFALGSGRGVAFRESEVQILFPRPFSRWQILLLKFFAAQFPAVIGSLLIGLMFRRFGTFSYGNVVAGFWLNQVALYANSTLMGLWLANLKARGGNAAKWTRAPAWTLLFAIGICAWLGWRDAGGVHSWEEAKLLLASPAVAAVLSPFTALAEVLTTNGIGAFVWAALLPIGLIAVQAFLIWRLDFGFEDQAVEIAQKIQNIKKDGLGAMQSEKELVIDRSGLWSLAPTGPAWHALVWKNIISLGRFPRRMWIRIAIIVVAMAVIFGLMISDDEDADTATRIGFLVLGLMLYASILAPTMVRVDLRIDILHFDVLKAMPIRGRSLVFGEIMGPVLVLWAFQILGCIVAVVLITREGDYVFTWLDKAPALAGLVCAFFALDFTWVTAENLMALWLPGFTRLGRGVRAGFDQVGQNLMGALIRMLVLVVLIVIPAILGSLLGVGLHAVGFASLAVAATLGVVLGSVLLVVESGVLIMLSDARYERFDITSENLVEPD